jgi:hypothetical protein
MAEKTYQVDVSHESMAAGDRFVSKETPRLAALVGVGYMHEVEAYAQVDDWVDEADDAQLLERFEDLDAVEVLGEPVASKRRTRKE